MRQGLNFGGFMRQLKSYKWTGDIQEGVLFAVQRLDEILFFYSKDTCKV